MHHHEQIDIPFISSNQADVPVYSSTGASGADVKACITDDITIEPGTTCLIPTGLSFAIPLGYEIQVRPRSGLALKHQISVLNTPGTIDADYRGEVGIIIINHGKNEFTVTPGMRIAQLVLTPVLQAHFVPAQDLIETARNTGGFGHTGLN